MHQPATYSIQPEYADKVFDCLKTVEILYFSAWFDAIRVTEGIYLVVKSVFGSTFSFFFFFAIKYFEIFVIYLNSCKVGSNTVEINQGFTNIFVNKN